MVLTKKAIIIIIVVVIAIVIAIILGLVFGLKGKKKGSYVLPTPTWFLTPTSGPTPAPGPTPTEPCRFGVPPDTWSGCSICTVPGSCPGGKCKPGYESKNCSTTRGGGRLCECVETPI